MLSDIRQIVVKEHGGVYHTSTCVFYAVPSLHEGKCICAVLHSKCIIEKGLTAYIHSRKKGCFEYPRVLFDEWLFPDDY